MISITTVARENHAPAFLTDIHPHREIPASGMNRKAESYLVRAKTGRVAEVLMISNIMGLGSCVRNVPDLPES